MRLGACPGPLQIETPFAIPDTPQTSFRDGKPLPPDCVAIDSDFCALRSKIPETGMRIAKRAFLVHGIEGERQWSIVSR
jgi:hypothetical protein